ncbi:RNA-guided endonuclease InsQ/TnpB family protein [Thiofilum flexile]|uniref:RNA-guided endonuclease InsQ/TnpB family protein n=1 Tax=Thiofilum flexile TaxID=125627 RepID=UPI000376124B|nr:RNA-guided endonuclease TnpB family protein [Thiofilum flexile]
MTYPLVTVLKTLKVRVKDKHKSILERMAFEVNQVWNAANEETAYYAHLPIPEVGWLHVYLSAFDLAKSQAALRKERGFLIHSQTVQEVTEAHERARKQFKKSKLRWRISSGSKRSLGWIPFKKGAAVWKSGQVRYAGHYFKVWDSYGLAQYEFRFGSFSQDARGRWYFNVVVAVPVIESIAQGQIGIDLGLKDTATCSNGLKLESKQFYRELESKLGVAQRAKQKKRVKAIHAKIKNRRLNSIHQFTTQVVKNNSLIIIGNVSSSALAKTKMAKSVLDAGWHILKTQLKYKASARSGVCLEVNESYTTQACSCCGCIGSNSPKGRTGLRIREWSCSECGATHDRDINAAKNILALGHERLAAGIPVL